MNKNKFQTSVLSGRKFVAEVLNRSEANEAICFELYRMEKECHVSFCNEVKGKNYLIDYKDVLVEEKVAMF